MTRRRRIHAAHLFVLPHTIFLVLFGLGPALYALLLSFAAFERGRPQFFEAGLSNYVTAYTDFRFGSAFIHVGQFLAISLPLGIVGVVAIALVLHAREDRLSSIMRTLYFVPGAVAGPTVVLLAIFMFDPLVSPFGPALQAMGVTSLGDLTRNDNLPLLFTLMGFFAGAGGWIAIFYGGLNGISREVVEAAIVDGCSAWRLAISVKLPLIRPYVIYMLILTFAGNVQLFAEPQLLSGIEGRGITISKYWSPNQLSYAFAFELGDFGAAAAISLLMLAIGLVGAMVVIATTDFFRTDVSAG